MTISIRDGALGISPDGLRWFPLLVAFFVISRFRAVFQFPAELAANSLFRMTEAGCASRRAARKRVLVSGLAPVLVFFLPVEAAAWRWKIALFHTAFQFATVAPLIEVLFWNFVPFTDSYFPRSNQPGRSGRTVSLWIYQVTV